MINTLLKSELHQASISKMGTDLELSDSLDEECVDFVCSLLLYGTMYRHHSRQCEALAVLPEMT